MAGQITSRHRCPHGSGQRERGGADSRGATDSRIRGVAGGDGEPSDGFQRPAAASNDRPRRTAPSGSRAPPGGRSCRLAREPATPSRQPQPSRRAPAVPAEHAGGDRLSPLLQVGASTSRCGCGSRLRRPAAHVAAMAPGGVFSSRASPLPAAGGKSTSMTGAPAVNEFHLFRMSCHGRRRRHFRRIGAGGRSGQTKRPSAGRDATVHNAFSRGRGIRLGIAAPCRASAIRDGSRHMVRRVLECGMRRPGSARRCPSRPATAKSGR